MSPILELQFVRKLLLVGPKLVKLLQLAIKLALWGSFVMWQIFVNMVCFMAYFVMYLLPFPPLKLSALFHLIAQQLSV